jgi:hypothetical protein
MADLRRIAIKAIPYLPFIVLGLAVIVAVYHIKAYW